MTTKHASIQYGDRGVEIRVEIRTPNNELVDLSGITTASSGEKYIIFQKPSGATVRKTAAFVSDGTDGLLLAILNPNDIDQIGVFKVQAYVKSSTGSYHTEKGSLEVLSNIDVAF